MAFTGESAGTGPVNLKVERVLPWQITMDQLIFVSFPHPLLDEVGMLKVPAAWVGLGRVGQEVKKNNLRSKDDVWTVVFSESPWTANRRSPLLVQVI